MRGEDEVSWLKKLGVMAGCIVKALAYPEYANRLSALGACKQIA